jgi:hypothetical protein
VQVSDTAGRRAILGNNSMAEETYPARGDIALAGPLVTGAQGSFAEGRMPMSADPRCRVSRSCLIDPLLIAERDSLQRETGAWPPPTAPLPGVDLRLGDRPRRRRNCKGGDSSSLS